MKFVFNRRSSSPVGSFILLSTCATVALVVGIITATPSDAISITNRDDKDHKITVIEGEAKTDHALKAAAVLENLCMKGCVVRLNDSENDEYELEGTEVVSIEDGYLYYDGPDTPTEPAPPAAPGAAPKPQ